VTITEAKSYLESEITQMQWGMADRAKTVTPEEAVKLMFPKPKTTGWFIE
jgi:hypothetical protein